MTPDFLLRTFLGQEWFRPGACSSSFKAWREKGVMRLCDVAPNGQLLGKDRLEELYGMRLPWLEYLQLANLFRKTPVPNPADTPLTTFERLMK